MLEGCQSQLPRCVLQVLMLRRGAGLGVAALEVRPARRHQSAAGAALGSSAGEATRSFL